MYFTRWNTICQIVSGENATDLRKKRTGYDNPGKWTGDSAFVRAEPPGGLLSDDHAFFAIFDQESFSATVRLNTGCSGAWSFGSEKK